MLAVESVAQGRTRGDSGQLKVFAVMIGLYVLAAAVYILVPGGMLDPASTPAALAAAIASSQPASVSANGFSQKMCLPAAAAATCSACRRPS